MCGCGSEKATTTTTTGETVAGIVFKVEDMTCGHCAGTIRNALKEALPGAAFDVDLDSKRVTVPHGAAVIAEAAIRDAGYEPQLVAV